MTANVSLNLLGKCKLIKFFGQICGFRETELFLKTFYLARFLDLNAKLLYYSVLILILFHITIWV